MTVRYAMIVAVACAAAGTVCGDVEPLAVTESACTYTLYDSSGCHAVKTAADQTEFASRSVTRRAGEMVKLTAPDGTVTTLVDGSSGATGATLPSLDAGGVWTLSNSRQGTVTFIVRRSLDGSIGAGTPASPARLVDGDELVDYGAGAGYTFTAEGSGSLLSEIKLPEGFAMEKVGDGVWSLVSSSDGRLYTWAQIAYRADSRREGPDRMSKSTAVPPVAYSGDDWLGAASKASTLTFVSPDGTETILDKTGTGAQSFTFDKPGHWTVRLVAGGTTRTADILIRDTFTVIIR